MSYEHNATSDAFLSDSWAAIANKASASVAEAWLLLQGDKSSEEWDDAMKIVEEKAYCYKMAAQTAHEAATKMLNSFTNLRLKRTLVESAVINESPPSIVPTLSVWADMCPSERKKWECVLCSRPALLNSYQVGKFCSPQCAMDVTHASWGRSAM